MKKTIVIKFISVLTAAALACGMPSAVFADGTDPALEIGLDTEESIPAEQVPEENVPEENIPEEQRITEDLIGEETPEAEEKALAEESVSSEESVPAEEPVLLAASAKRPDPTSITKLTVGTKRITVKWEALPGQAEGYQIQYGTAKDFSSDAKKLIVKGETAASAELTGLSSGKRYYVRIRAFRSAEDKKVFAKWSAVKSAKLTWNTIKITGSALTRNIYIMNPKSSIKSARVAVWTEENGQDDLVWYRMKKTSAGNWKAVADVSVLVHEGNAWAHVYANDDDDFIGDKSFVSPPLGFPICSSEKEYIERIAPAVKAACAKYGYLPSVLIAQSCLENGYGIPSYWDNPEIAALLRFNNMVGLKSELLNSSWYDKTVWPGRSIVKKTPEEYGGVPVIITDSFRVYDSIEQSFEDYLLFMKYASNYGYGGTPKYGKKILTMKDPEKLIKAVSSRGYATGSTYPDSVMRIIKKHKLTKYDK